MTSQGLYSKLQKPKTEDPSTWYWSELYGFAQCNCTSYVAYKINEALERHNPTDPMFTNHFHDLTVSDGFKWGDAAGWEDAVKTAVPGYVSRYPETLPENDPSYPWKMAPDGTIYDVRFAIAWWDAWSGNSYGHVAWVESVGSDGKTVVVSEYNGEGTHLFDGADTLTPDGKNGRYPDGFLYIFTDSFLECDLTGLCGGGSGGIGGSGGGFTDQVNLKLDFDIMHPDGYELYASTSSNI